MTDVETGTAGRDPGRVVIGPRTPRAGSAAVNGARLAYHAWDGPARPTRPPAVLLHGVLQTKEGMANLAAHLARGGPVLVPDLRGRGDSDRPPAGYDPATLADDVAALIEALALDRPVLIGRLHGGVVAYHLAARRPDLVRGLVLGNTSPEVDPARAERANAATRALPDRFASFDAALAFYVDRLGLAEARARHDIPHDLVADPDGDGAGLRWRYDLALVARIESAAMPRADWDLLAGVACPMLLLRGQRGDVSADVARRVAATVPVCHTQTVLGARNDVFLGPGAEQSFGAIDLFLLRLHGPAAGAQLPLSGAAPAVSDVAVVPGASEGSAAAAVERIVRAINARDAEAAAAAFAPDGRIAQYRSEGLVREGGPEAARAAFADVLAGLPGGVVEARDVVAGGDRAACVLVVRDPVAPAGDASTVLLAPVFLRVRDGRIVELASYGLRLPADRI